jgi:hypothetical protein
MKKKILTIGVIALLVANSASARFYEGSVRECPALYDIGKWTVEYTLDGREYWGRREAWIQGSWETVRGNSFNFNPAIEKSYHIRNNPKTPYVIVYIGPWQKVTLTKGFLWNKEVIETEIRMIASQNGKFLEAHYETKDEENAKIPEERFVPLEEPNDLITKCDILRAQKWGYDAVLEGHINIFRGYLGKSPFATTGKIINAYTKEVIADEKANLIKPKIETGE